MKRLCTQVGRADILRLLAVSRTASADIAAKRAGYFVQLEDDPAKGKRITRSSIRSHTRTKQAHIASLKPLTLATAQDITRTLPPEAFWHLAARKTLKKNTHRLTVPHAPQSREALQTPRSILPAVLDKVAPLTAEELFVPIFTPCVPCTNKLLPPSPPVDLSAQHRSQKKSRTRSSSEQNLEHLVASTAELLAFQPEKGKHHSVISRKKQHEKRHHLRIRRLLGLLSVAAYADAQLLQEIIRLIPSSVPGITTEAALRAHPDTEQDSKLHLALNPEKKKVYYQFFAQEEAGLQAEMLALLRQRDARPAPLLFALELLPVLPFIHATVIKQQITTWLESFILRFTRTWFEQQQDSQMSNQAEHLLNFIEVLPQECRKQLTARSFLYGIVHQKVLRSGSLFSPEYDAETVIQTVRKAIPPVSYQVLQQGEKLFLYPSKDIALSQLAGSPLLEFELSVDCLLLHKIETQQGIATLPVQSGTLLHDCTCQDKEFYLQTPTEQLIFSTCFCPSWAQSMGRNSKGLFVDTFWLGKRYRLTWQNCTAEEDGTWAGNGELQADQYGLFIDLKIKEKVTQRFRRITPGWFMMGSPDDEAERESWGKEALHEVILTKGFWVADTAVTQELWQAVVGNNPSSLKRAAYPVDQVSYQDAVLFLKLLNKRIPGLKARLLTEAEWEYCCRAGTATPFSFGNRITAEQVNYNGQHPYDTGRAGKNRQQPVAVKSLPCNNWGLFEMHGNVWEWCQDYWQEDLSSEEPQLDPTGPEYSEFRVVRGGSWFLSGGGVRSAVRGKFAPHFRNPHIGFRIALTPDEEPGTAPSSQST
uniref:formylglycine-generating enzyme family protein n=1 Tax=Candidatus Electrothrix sp. TaxID=2170559 RepID=UPI00405600F9